MFIVSFIGTQLQLLLLMFDLNDFSLVTDWIINLYSIVREDDLRLELCCILFVKERGL